MLLLTHVYWWKGNKAGYYSFYNILGPMLFMLPRRINAIEYYDSIDEQRELHRGLKHG